MQPYKWNATVSIGNSAKAICVSFPLCLTCAKQEGGKGGSNIQSAKSAALKVVPGLETQELAKPYLIAGLPGMDWNKANRCSDSDRPCVETHWKAGRNAKATLPCCPPRGQNNKTPLSTKQSSWSGGIMPVEQSSCAHILRHQPVHGQDLSV